MSAKVKHGRMLKRLFSAAFILLILTGGCVSGAEENPDEEAESAAVETEETAPEETAGISETEEDTFTFLWMTDTQKSAGHRGEYQIIGDWCMDALERENICCLLHTGDIVGVYNSEFQWDEALNALNPLREKLPNLFISGNHDMIAKMKNYEYFRAHIYSADEIAAMEAAGESWNRGQGRYMLATFGGIDFLFLGMSYQYLEPELEWMDGVLKQYPDRIAVLLLHNYMWGDARILNDGQQVMDKVIAPNPNVRLVLSGHHAGVNTRRDDFVEQGRFVQTVLCNTQDDAGRRGTVMLLKINPAAGTVSMHAWSPVRYEKPPIDMTLEIDLH